MNRHLKAGNQLLIFFLLFFVVSSCGQKNANDILTGKAVHIADGDTFTLLTGANSTARIRLFGIDAPERGQDFYRISKDYLGELLLNQTVTVRIRDKDQYARIVGDVYLPDKTYVNKSMIEAGLAWHFKEFSSDKDLADAEKNAREKHLGLWQFPDPQAPWKWRREKRNANTHKQQ